MPMFDGVAFGSGNVTIRDVARAADVSTASVSRALDGSVSVSPDMRERVLKAVRETGYRPNLAARDLRKGRLASALLLVPNLANPFFSTIIEAIGRVLGEAGISVQVVDTRQSAFRLSALGRDGQADGIICFDGSLSADALLAARIPFVMACEWFEGLTAPGCAVDNAEGARLSAHHLLELGHRHLLHVTGPAGNVLADARQAAFGRSVDESGAECSFIPGDFSLESGAQAARLWNGSDPSKRATGVFCASDECALGFLSSAIQMGFAVPQDVSVCGFDDIAVSAYFVPSLTTIHQPRYELGGRVARELLHLLGGGVASEPVVIPVELAARASTGPAPTTTI